MNSSNVLIFGQDSDITALTFGVGSEAMRITSSGNVGIGTTAPDTFSYGGTRKFLTLRGTATNEEPFLQLIANGSGNSLIDFGNSTIRRATIIGFDGSHLGFFTNGSNSGTGVSERMRITSSGNVLIGTTTDAGFRLQVNGEGRFYQSATNTSAYLRVENNRSRNAALRLTTTVGDYYLGVGIGADVNQFQIFDGNAGETRLTIASTGAATFSNDIFARSGTIDSRAFKIYEASAGRGGLYPYNLVAGSGTDYSIGIFSEGEIFLASGGSATKRVVLTSGGNVGIGTTSPTIFGGGLEVSRAGQAGVRVSSTGSGGGGIEIGNANSTGGYLQTVQTGGQISFYTGNADTLAMRMTSGGNVLIGTSTDVGSVRLQVAPSAVGWISQTIAGAGGTNKVVIGNYNGLAAIGGHNSALSAWAPLDINFDGGNVLIGTTSDVGATLHVNGTIRTGAPSGGSAVNWRLGTARGGTVTTNATVRVEIDGVLVDLVARYV
jgi:hypothetical protein